MTPDDPDLPDMTAAELALGLLDGEERATAMRRMLAEPEFAREVGAWRNRLAGLFDDYRDVAPPAGFLDRLSDQPRKSNWRWPAIGAIIAVAAALALFMVSRPAPPPPQVEAPHRVLVAALVTTDKQISVPAVIDATTGEVRIAGASLSPSDKSAELWMIGADGVPKSMGLLASSGSSKITLPAADRAQLNDGITLAVSVEPMGGSPTGKPTGPVVASGKLSIA